MKEILIAVVGLVVGAIVGPYINWGIEKKKQKLAYRKEQIAKWRAMLAEAAKLKATNEDSVMEFLERHPDFYSLKPHVNYALATGRASARVTLAGTPDPTIPRVLADLIEEVGRVEAEWDLV